MQLKTITAAKDAGIDGIEFVKTDKAITEVIIGGRLRIRKGENYSAALQVLVEQPFEEAKRFRAVATIEGFDPKFSYHDTDYDARTATSDLPAAATVAIDEVSVLLNESGEVVGVVGETQPIDDDMVVPF